MFILFSILFGVVGTTLGGIFTVATIQFGYTDFPAILEAVFDGFLLAIPISWVMTERLWRT
ncbi:MAG: CTP synthetase [Pseudomonadota bacterium]